MAGLVTDMKELPGARSQQSFNISLDYSIPSHKIGYSYNRNSLHLNRVRSGSDANCPVTPRANYDTGNRIAAITVQYEPLTCPCYDMGNTSSTKEAYLNGDFNKQKTVPRRKSSYISSFIDSVKSADETKEGKSVFGSFLKERAQSKEYKKRRPRLNAKKAHRYSDPTLSVNSLGSSAKKCHMSRASVPNCDNAGSDKGQFNDSCYANCDIKIGRSYNDILYHSDQKIVRSIYEPPINNNDTDNSHTYENFDFFLHRVDKLGSNITLENLNGNIATLYHNERLDNNIYPEKSSFLDLPSQEKIENVPISKAKIDLNPTTLFRTNSAIPSLLDAINAIGEEFSSDTDSGSSKSGNSSPSVSYEDNLLSGSVYFSINELQSESPACEVIDGDYSYFSFYQEFPVNTKAHSVISDSTDIFTNLSNSYSNLNHEYQKPFSNIDFNQLDHVSSLDENYFLSRSESDLFKFESGYDNVPAYENTHFFSSFNQKPFDFENLTINDSKRSDDNISCSDFDDVQSRFSDVFNLYHINENTINFQMTKSFPKKPPHPPTRRKKEFEELISESPCDPPRLRSRSMSCGRSAQGKEITKRPASYGSSDFDEHASQESIIKDEIPRSALQSYVIDHAPSPKWLAERKKADGNSKYINKQYREALEAYTKAIELCPDCAAYYSNRSACFMMLGKYSNALADARQSVKLDTEFVKGYLRVGKCNIALGDANAALFVLRQASEIDATKAIRDEMVKAQSLAKGLEDINKYVARKDYRTAVFHIDKALQFAVACQSLKISKAENLVLLERFSEAEAIVNDILQNECANADAIYVRGLCLYYQDNQAAAFTHFQHVLRLAPDHKKAKDVYKKAKLLRQKKEAGNQAFSKSQWLDALNLYTEAIAIDPSNKITLAKLYFNRATVRAKLSQLEGSVSDCTEAIALNEDYIKAYVRRGKSHQLIENYEDAVRDFEKANRLIGNREYDNLVRESKAQLKMSKRKDYYKILGINKDATDDQIRKAYKKKALLHHPDRHAKVPEKERKEEQIKFQQIGEAYAVLSDPKKKKMYENGQDMGDNDEFGFGDGGFDPTDIFQAFFGGNGGGGGGGCGGRTTYSFGGGASGFNFM